MKRIVMMLAVIIISVSSIRADELVLPTDEGKWYFTVAGDVDYEISGPTIDALKKQTHYRHIPQDDPIYSRYEACIGPTPSVFIQRADGSVVFKIGGANFPESAAELDQAISKCRPKPQPTPVPTPAPRPNIDITIVPDTFVPDTVEVPEENEGLNLLYLAISALGGAAGGYFNMKKGEE